MLERVIPRTVYQPPSRCRLHTRPIPSALGSREVRRRRAYRVLDPNQAPCVVVGQSHLMVDFGSRSRLTLPLLFLRDSCPCADCRHQVTHQRLVDTFSLPTTPVVRRTEATADGMLIEWEDGAHSSLYPWTWLHGLLSNRLRREADDVPRDVDGNVPKYRHWDASISRSPPSISYDEVMQSDAGVRKWTSLIRSYGLSFVEGCPATPEATERLLQRIAFIRATHYGAFWDFTSDLRSKDTAYTSISLEAHTDTNYFQDPAGLQMFHMLSHTDGQGGASLFVDGYKVAAELEARHPALGRPLEEQRVLYECKGNDDVMLHASWPVLPSAGTPEDGAAIGPHEPLAPIRWNNSDRASAAIGSHAATEEWYKAARAFDSILKDPALEYWVQLKPGTPVSK